MYQRIFVPIDSSETCATVLNQVRQLASESHARVFLVKIVDARQFAESPGELIKEIREPDALRQNEGRHASMLGFLNEAAAPLRAAGIEVETRLVEKFGHKISEIIVNEATSWQADLIVMATHGRSGLTHLLMGSVTEEVMHHTTVPLLLIKIEDDDEGLE